MKTKSWLFILAGLLLLTAGFFAGRWTAAPEIKTRYVKGQETHDTLYSEVLVPYNSKIPDNPVLPTKPDTIKLPGLPEYITLKVDTAKIIANYVKENSYKNILFDNTDGKLIIESVVQYNAMKKMAYTFTPIQKEVTKIYKPVITPYLGVSYNSFGYYGAGGGIYYHDVGVGAKYMTNFNNKGYEISLNYKF